MVALACLAIVLAALPATAQQVKPVPKPTPPTPPPVIVPAPPLPPASARRPAMITDPVWARGPMPEYPERAMANGVHDGRVTLQCAIRPDGALLDCSVIEETPAGQGFAASALAAAARARLAPRSMDAAAGANVRFTIRYISPMEEPPVGPPPGTPSVIVPPVRVPIEPAYPDPEVYLRNQSWASDPRIDFPAEAREAGEDRGMVVLACGVLEDGALAGCTALVESPSGVGFARAALVGLRGARLAERRPSHPGAVIRVHVTVHFDSRGQSRAVLGEISRRI